MTGHGPHAGMVDARQQALTRQTAQDSHAAISAGADAVSLIVERGQSRLDNLPFTYILLQPPVPGLFYFHALNLMHASAKVNRFLMSGVGTHCADSYCMIFTLHPVCKFNGQV